MNPYKSLEERAFWAPAVGQRDKLEIADLWRPKFDIAPDMRTVTFGSCFAQHFAVALTSRGFAWHNAENPPPRTPDDVAKKFSYGIFSARTGNIYTTSLLLQWARWALIRGEDPPDEVWEQDGRFYDPFRPVVEPNGFATRKELLRSRRGTLQGFRRAVKTADLFVFTLGLTESWWATSQAYEYPMCPGTVAGTFDATAHHFINQDYGMVHDNLTQAMALMRDQNPDIRFLLTVSPVPLTATMSGNHVLVATMESKAILRAAAAAIARQHEDTDYFPSFEIINSAPYEGAFFEKNKRSVKQAGVDHVMANFFAGLSAAGMPTASTRPSQVDAEDDDDDLACEEALLAAFQPGNRTP